MKDIDVNINSILYGKINSLEFENLKVINRIDILEDDLNDYKTKINFVEFKNYVGEDVFEENKFWTTNANKIVKATNYFAPNSIAVFREVTIKLKNTSGSKIEKGTLVAYDNDKSKVRPMIETDDASIYAGFTIGDTEPNEACTVITDGFYRYTDDLTFGTKYGVSNGKPSKTSNNKVGICTGGGFIHLTARY